MLGVGWTEVVFIGIVALIVIGPKELPTVMRRIGQFAGTIRRMGSEFQRELNKTTGLNEIANLRNSVTAPLKATADAIRKEFNATTSTGAVVPSGAIKPADPKVESVVDEIRAQAGMAAPAVSPAPAAAVAEPAPAAAPAQVAPAPPPSSPDVAAVAPAVTLAPNDTAPKKPRAPRVKPVPAAAAVETAELPAAEKPKRTRKAATIESPGPAEAVPPPTEAAAKTQRSRKVSPPGGPVAGAEAVKPKRTRKPATPPSDET